MRRANSRFSLKILQILLFAIHLKNSFLSFSHCSSKPEGEIVSKNGDVPFDKGIKNQGITTASTIAEERLVL